MAKYTVTSNFYTANRVTEKIGQQSITMQDWQKAELGELLKAVYADKDPQTLANPIGTHGLDFYTLGYIHGKQAERERRHKQ